jgi:hypothetical protein
MHLTGEFPPAYSTSPARETPPAYSNSIFRSGSLNRKIEFSEPGIRPPQRSWRTIYATVHGTIFKVYELKFFDNNPYRYRIASVKQYTLQYAESGIAYDYKKRSWALRLRVEGEQFLLQCRSGSDRNAWLEAFQAAAEVALDIDVRDEPVKDLLQQPTARVQSSSMSHSFSPANSYMVNGRPCDLRCVPRQLEESAKVRYQPADQTETEDGESLSPYVSADKVRVALASSEAETVYLPALGFGQERKFALVIIKGKEVFVNPLTNSISNVRHKSEKETSWTRLLSLISVYLRHFNTPILD